MDYFINKKEYIKYFKEKMCSYCVYDKNCNDESFIFKIQEDDNNIVKNIKCNNYKKILEDK